MGSPDSALAKSVPRLVVREQHHGLSGDVTCEALRGEKIASESEVCRLSANMDNNQANIVQIGLNCL